MAHRQICNHFFARAQSPWNTGQTRSPPELPGWSKSPPHIFFVLTTLDCFDLGTYLKSYDLSQGSDVAYIGHWPLAIYLFDRQTDRLKDRQSGRQTYIFCHA